MKKKFLDWFEAQPDVVQLMLVLSFGFLLFNCAGFVVVLIAPIFGLLLPALLIYIVIVMVLNAATEHPNPTDKEEID